MVLLPLEMYFAETPVVSLNPQGDSLNQVPGQRNHHPSPADPHLLLPAALKGKRAAYI